MVIEEPKSANIIEELKSANITNTQLHVRLTPTKLIRTSGVLLYIKQTNRSRTCLGCFKLFPEAHVLHSES